MQERKRLEEAIAHEAEVARLTSDLDTLFELGREGEDVSSDLAREIKPFLNAWRCSRPGCCCPARTIRKARFW